MTLDSLFDSEFNTKRELWEKALLAELKIQELGNKTSRKLLSGETWPTLSLEAESKVHISPTATWKKASTTYASEVNEEYVREDLEAGVRNFFLMSERSWPVLESVLRTFPHQDEVEVINLTGSSFSSSSIKVLQNLISGKETEFGGGHAVHELATMAVELIKNLKSTEEAVVGVYVDSQFFQSIAKVRAARLLALKILQEENRPHPVRIIALTSFTNWTLFERYSNMLRNETAVAAAYIGGADHVQSTGYNALFELETKADPDAEHSLRSQRMARNTAHILGLESMLGLVEDASFGSYHLENLTGHLCSEAWALMQKILSGHDLSEEVKAVREQRLMLLKNRKIVLSGTNDYPDRRERLNITLKAPLFFRLARPFEELRLEVERLKSPEVYVALFGDYGALNARLNFVKNYFELLGLTVHEPGHSVTDLHVFASDLEGRSEEILVLCAADDQYAALNTSQAKAGLRYIAGKTEREGFKNLFAGQNVYEVLQNLVSELKGRNL